MPRRLRIAALVAASTFAASAASAHLAPTGWRYDNYCCGGQDCQPIPVENVNVTAEGYEVSLPDGSHQTARGAKHKLFHYDEVLMSQDENYHACVLPNTQEFRCLYVPPMGA